MKPGYEERPSVCAPNWRSAVHDEGWIRGLLTSRVYCLVGVYCVLGSGDGICVGMIPVLTAKTVDSSYTSVIWRDVVYFDLQNSDVMCAG